LNKEFKLRVGVVGMVGFVYGDTWKTLVNSNSCGSVSLSSAGCCVFWSFLHCVVVYSLVSMYSLTVYYSDFIRIFVG
jgi:hypothetical protein